MEKILIQHLALLCVCVCVCLFAAVCGLTAVVFMGLHFAISESFMCTCNGCKVMCSSHVMCLKCFPTQFSNICCVPP